MHWHYDCTLQVYREEDHQRVGTLSKPDGEKWWFDASVSIHQSEYIAVCNIGSLNIYDAQCQHVRHFDIPWGAGWISCSDDYIVTAGLGSVTVWRWELKKVAELTKAELQVDGNIWGVWCGEGDVLHVRENTYSSNKLIAYRLQIARTG